MSKIVLVPRLERNRVLDAILPILAILLTMLVGAILFSILGKDPIATTKTIFIEPLFSSYSRPELFVKAAPLIIIALGLSVGFRANIWNIGAEGQFIMGAIAASAVGLAFYDVEAWWILPLMCIAGIIGGFLWALIPAILKAKFQTNEILVSLMLVYVADLFLFIMVSGPLRDPMGMSFPQSRQFHDSALLPILVEGTRIHLGVAIAFLLAILGYIFLRWMKLGFDIQVAGQSPKAARFAGISSTFIIIFCLGLSGALAGLAGTFEVAGPIGQLTESLPTGYGFTAIIVAFLGRLNPFGIVIAAFVIAITYIGGENAQIFQQLPSDAVKFLQGLLLIFLLAVEVFASYRVVVKG